MEAVHVASPRGLHIPPTDDPFGHPQSCTWSPICHQIHPHPSQRDTQSHTEDPIIAEIINKHRAEDHTVSPAHQQPTTKQPRPRAPRTQPWLCKHRAGGRSFSPISPGAPTCALGSWPADAFQCLRCFGGPLRSGPDTATARTVEIMMLRAQQAASRGAQSAEPGGPPLVPSHSFCRKPPTPPDHHPLTTSQPTRAA